MSLKDIADQSSKNLKKSINKNSDEDGDKMPHEKLIALSFIEGLNQYLYGVYVGYCKCKGETILDGEDFLSEIKKIPKMEKDDKKREYLRKNSKIGTFLIWYLYE